MLEQGRSADRDPLLAMLHDLVRQSGWRPMCERLLPFMGEAELLRMGNSLGQQAQQQPQQQQPQKEHQQPRQRTEQGGSLSSSSLAAWAVSGSSCTARDLAPLLLSGVVWDSAKDAVLANALGCHRASLWKLLQEQGREAGEQEEEAAEQLAKLMLTAEQLHGPDGCSEAVSDKQSGCICCGCALAFCKVSSACRFMIPVFTERTSADTPEAGRGLFTTLSSSHCSPKIR